jgi:hypothetical protein
MLDVFEMLFFFIFLPNYIFLINLNFYLMKKITFLLFTFLLLLSSWQSQAQFGCGSGVVISDGYTVSGITTPGTAGVEDWNSPNPVSMSNGVNAFYFDDDVYMFQYTAGATVEQISMTTFTRNSWNGLAIFETCSGTALDNSLNAAGTTTANVSLTVTAMIDPGQTVYIATGQWGTPDGLNFDVTNFTVTPITCLYPSGISLSNLTTSSADLDWIAGGSETAWNLEWKAGANFTPGNGEQDQSAAVSGTPEYSLTGLTASTTYYVYYQSDCGTGNTSSWVGPFSFYTGYCIPVATSALSYINSISTTSGLTNITNADTGFTAGGYADYYDTHTIETYAGGSFDFEFSIVGGTVGAAIWVDWNHDLIFGTDEVGYTTTAYGDGPFTGTAVVPVGVPNGDYRVRVMIDYNDLNPGDDAACGFAFGRGEVEDYKMTISDAPTDAPDWYNIQWLSDGTNGSNTSLTVNAWTTVTGYAQAWEPGVTDAAGQGAGLECWIGGNPSNTDPATWPEDAWDMATYFGDSGNNDEYSINKVMDFSGTVYVASRWRLNGAPYVYGGYNNPWNGTSANSIELIVNPVLANDNCDGAVALTVNTDLSCTTVTSGTTVNATESQADDNAPCAGNNDDDVWYSFEATATTHVVTLSNVVAVTGTSTDMYMQVLSGSCGTLTSILCSDPNTATVSGLTIGETYLVRVYSYYDTARQTFDICVGTFPPPPANDNCDGAYTLTVNSDYACGAVTSGTLSSATSSGVSESACAGTENDDVWFSFVATNSAHRISILNVTPYTDMYHSLWTGDCSGLTLVSGSCSDSDTSNRTGLVVGTTYYVRVNSYGSTSGLLTTFNVCIGTPPPPPANDACANAVNVMELPYSQTQDASAATNNAGYILACSSSSYGGMNDGVWYSFTGSGTAQTVTLNLCASAYDTSVLVYTGTTGNLALLAGNDDDATCVNTTRSKVSFNSDGTTTYYIAIEGYNSSSYGAYTMDVDCADINPPAVANQSCDLALAVNVDAIDVQSDNSYGTVNPVQTTCDLFGSIQDVWFSFVAPTSGTVDCLVTNGTMTSSNFTVYSGACGTLTEVSNTCNSNLTTPTTESLTALVAGNTYFVQVWSNAAEQGTFTLRLTDPSAVGIADNHIDGFKMYPNPTESVLNISALNTIDSLVIYSMLGQKVLSQETFDNQV